MRTLYVKYKAIFMMTLISSLEYRFEFFIGILSTIFPIIIQVFLWSAIYGVSGDSSMYGYNFSQMISYVFIAGTVSKFVVTGIEGVLNDDIHSGGLAEFLVKPVKYIPYRVCRMIGQKVTSTVIMILFTTVIVMLLHFTIGFKIYFSAVLLFVPALILATVLNFYIFFLMGTFSFWLTEAIRFFHSLQVIIMVLSGGVFPITVLGNTYVHISELLPFSYTTYFPISVVTGAMPLYDILYGIFIQVIWITVLYTVSNMVWRRGIKRYVAVGG